MAKKEKVDELKEMIAAVDHTMSNLRRNMGHIQSQTTQCMKSCSHQIEQINELLKTYAAVFSESARVSENVNETLGAVLLAIRQNEYLQAYYPEQHGFKAGKYTGQHPAKLMGKAEKKQAK